MTTTKRSAALDEEMEANAPQPGINGFLLEHPEDLQENLSEEESKEEVGSGGVGWGWGSTLTHNYGGLRRGGGNQATQQLVSN